MDLGIFAQLTEREQEILLAILEHPNLTLEHIGQRLQITGRTIRTHVSNMLQKTGFNCLRALAIAAMREQLTVQGVTVVMATLDDSGQLRTELVQPVDVSTAVWRLAKGRGVYIQQNHVSQVKRILGENSNL